MAKIKTVPIGCLVAGIAMITQTGTLRAEPGFISPVHILSVHVRESVVDLHTETFTNPAGCVRIDVLRVRNETLNADKIYAAALSAHAQSKKITAWVHSCDTDGFPDITTLWVQ